MLNGREINVAIRIRNKKRRRTDSCFISLTDECPDSIAGTRRCGFEFYRLSHCIRRVLGMPTALPTAAHSSSNNNNAWINGTLILNQSSICARANAFNRFDRHRRVSQSVLSIQFIAFIPFENRIEKISCRKLTLIKRNSKKGSPHTHKTVHIVFDLCARTLTNWINHLIMLICCHHK